VGLKDSDGAIFDSIVFLVLDMESGSNPSRAPTENRFLPSEQTPQEVPVEDGYTEYDQPSKKPKGQSKVWDEYEKIKGQLKIKPSASIVKLCSVLIVDVELLILNAI